jgi:hypothetical protein
MLRANWNSSKVNTKWIHHVRQDFKYAAPSWWTGQSNTTRQTLIHRPSNKKFPYKHKRHWNSAPSTNCDAGNCSSHNTSHMPSYNKGNNSWLLPEELTRPWSRDIMLNAVRKTLPLTQVCPLLGFDTTNRFKCIFVKRLMAQPVFAAMGLLQATWHILNST